MWVNAVVIKFLLAKTGIIYFNNYQLSCANRIALISLPEFNIGKMCKVLRVSRNGYYAWLNNSPSLRKQKNEELKLKMKIIFKEHLLFTAIGVSKKALHAQGENYNHKWIRKLMQEAQLKPKMRQRFKVTTKSDTTKQAAPNQLKQCKAPICTYS